MLKCIFRDLKRSYLDHIYIFTYFCSLLLENYFWHYLEFGLRERGGEREKEGGGGRAFRNLRLELAFIPLSKTLHRNPLFRLVPLNTISVTFENVARDGPARLGSARPKFGEFSRFHGARGKRGPQS